MSTGGTVLFLCPHCGVRLNAMAEQATMTVACPKCGASMTVPPSLTGPPDVSVPIPTVTPPPGRTEAPMSRMASLTAAFARLPLAIRAGVPIAMVAVVTLVVLAAVVASNSDDGRSKKGDQNAVSITPYRPLSSPEDAAVGALSWGCGGCAGFLVFVLVVIPVLHIALMIWVARNAKARGMEAAAWVLLVFFAGLIGLIIFVFSRPHGQLMPCRYCSNKRMQASRSCPHCGNT